MARAENRDWLADEFGDLRPEVAQALRAEQAPVGGGQAVVPPYVPPGRQEHEPAAPIPAWFPTAIMALLIVLGITLIAFFIAWNVRSWVERSASVQSYDTSVAATNVHLRTEPRLDGELRLILQPNQKLEVMEVRNGWAKVQAAGQEGWVYGGLLRGVGNGFLGPATVLKPITVRTVTGPTVLWLGQKLLIEGHAAPGYVVAILPDGRRASVPSARLLFTDGGP